MKIYRTVNPIAYENTYYLENDHSLILVDQGATGRLFKNK